MEGVTKEYGDIVHFRIGPYGIVILNHPDHIKDVMTTRHDNFVKGRPLEMARALLGDGLLTSEGDYHKSHSRIVQPAFHRKMIESYGSEMIDSTLQMMDSWEDGMQLDMREAMIRLSMIIAGKTLFGTELEDEAEEINDALTVAVNLFGRVSIPFAELWLNLPLPGSIRFRKAKARIDRTIYRIIDDRLQNPTENHDLIGLLLHAYDRKELDRLAVRDEAITLLLTAFDTTSNLSALCVTVYKVLYIRECV